MLYRLVARQALIVICAIAGNTVFMTFKTNICAIFVKSLLIVMIWTIFTAVKLIEIETRVFTGCAVNGSVIAGSTMSILIIAGFTSVGIIRAFFFIISKATVQNTLASL